MSPTAIVRALRLGGLNFLRNGWLSIASTLVIGITLFIVGVFIVQSIVILNTTESVQDKLDVAVYFNDDVSEEEIHNLRQKVANRPDVKQVEYINKDKAYEVWQGRNTPANVKGLITPENNPLPRSLSVKTHDPQKLATVAKSFETSDLEGKVRRISYQDNQSVIESLISAASAIRTNGAILTIIFVLLSFILIYNTTKIIILARKNEIEIMRLVGSTSAFVRAPFLIESAIFGTIGALIAGAALFFFLRYDLASSSPILSITKFLAPDMFDFFVANLLWVAPSLILLGIVLSMSMSYVAVRKYVKV